MFSCDTGSQTPGAACEHTPVMTEEILENLQVRAGGVYVDVTLGMGGHTGALLDHSAPDGVVVAMDRDPDAVNRAGKLMKSYGNRLKLFKDRFGRMSEVLRICGFEPGDVSGVCADLGLSSRQLNDEKRGFSFNSRGDLDMRMDPESGPTAADLIRDSSVDELGTIFRVLGEEPLGKRYAKAVKRAIDEKAEKNISPAELAQIIERAAGKKRCALSRRHPATKVFMALRMKVNRELEELETFLAEAPSWLSRGGRLAVISFHSLEDRMVKRRFIELAEPGRSVDPGLPLRQIDIPRSEFRLVFRKPRVPSGAELSRNPRSRSARLRVLERRQV